mmetsp:Transcript_14405/g.40664  ORF Transcript_14405/g.40664 Transcript_14405/m.40664 type:complete len:217 (+) Transcript_14405:590-1240(+)
MLTTDVCLRKPTPLVHGNGLVYSSTPRYHLKLFHVALRTSFRVSFPTNRSSRSTTASLWIFFCTIRLAASSTEASSKIVVAGRIASPTVRAVSFSMPSRLLVNSFHMVSGSSYISSMSRLGNMESLRRPPGVQSRASRSYPLTCPTTFPLSSTTWRPVTDCVPRIFNAVRKESSGRTVIGLGSMRSFTERSSRHPSGGQLSAFSRRDCNSMLSFAR